MEVTLAQTFSVEFDKTTKDREFTELDHKMIDYFKNRNYGDDVCTYLIGITCVHPKYDAFFPLKRPLYVQDRMICLDSALGKTHIYKTLTFKIKLDFEEFINSNTEEGQKMIARSIMERVRNLKYPAKIKDFDKERFFKDLTLFFEQQRLI